MNDLFEFSRGLVLFADDDAAAREGLAALLVRSGFKCVCAATADDALARLSSTEFDALVADIHMPGNVGLELIEAVPQVRSGLPMILLTGRPTVETAARAVRLSVAAYLTKPPDLAELCAVLDDAIADYRGFRALRAGRERLQHWERELDHVEKLLRQAPKSEGGPMQSFLRLTLRNVILMLADVERAAAALEQMPSDEAATIARLDHLVALRRTIDVLEKTRQNFKSRELGELRKQLEQLLARSGGTGAD